MTPTTAEPKSDFAKAIETRFANRRCHDFDIDGFFGLGNAPIPKVAIRVPTKREEIAAIDQAHAMIKSLCGQPEARTDADVIQDMKAACVAFWACRNVSNHKYHAFPGPQWMFEHLTGDQIGALVNLMNQVRVLESPTPIEYGDETIEAWAVVLANNAGSDLPTVQMAGLPREHLTYLLTCFAEKLATARTLLADVAKEAATEARL